MTVITVLRELGGASCRSSHVRNAPLATVGLKRRPVVMGQQLPSAPRKNQLRFRRRTTAKSDTDLPIGVLPYAMILCA